MQLNPVSESPGDKGVTKKLNRRLCQVSIFGESHDADVHPWFWSQIKIFEKQRPKIQSPFFCDRRFFKWKRKRTKLDKRLKNMQIFICKFVNFHVFAMLQNGIKGNRKTRKRSFSYFRNVADRSSNKDASLQTSVAAWFRLRRCGIWSCWTIVTCINIQWIAECKSRGWSFQPRRRRDFRWCQTPVRWNGEARPCKQILGCRSGCSRLYWKVSYF